MAKTTNRRRGIFIRRMIFTIGLLICLFPFAMRAINYVQVYQDMARVRQDKEDQERRAKALAKNQDQSIDLDHYGTSQLRKELASHLLGSIAIPAIKVQLPLFDNVSDNALNHGAGVVPGTSAPVGGKNTHTAISAHSGLPTKTMFSDLHELTKGDEFVITVAGKHRAYKVDKIQVIKPTDTKTLQIQAGRDLATLLTCTPVPANTHRLLVTGHRVPYTPATAAKVKAASQSGLWRNVVILAGIFWACVTLILYQVWRARKARK
jgi:sortase A